MSEHPSQHATAPLVDGTVVPPIPTDAGDGGGDRNPLVLVGAVVALAAMGAIAYFVLIPLLFGSDDPEPLIIVPPVDQAQSGDGDSVIAEGQVDAQPDGTIDGEDAGLASTAFNGQPVPETFEVFSSRDPFQQLVVERPAGSVDGPATADDADDGESDDSATTTATSTAPAADGSQPTVAAPDSDSGDLSADPADEPTDQPSSDDDGVEGQGTSPQSAYGNGEYWQRPDAGSIEVTFLATTITTGGSDAIVMTIDGTEYEVVEGQIFADRFWLLDIHDDCGTFLFGDSRFTMCVGETIMK